jgi:glycopeptide antibiotics resistance protein
VKILPLVNNTGIHNIKKTFLSAPWHNFNPNRSFFVDAILNLLAFTPLGTVTYCWLRQSHLLPSRYETTGIVVFCFSLSLSMEILQAWLPNRSSSLLDLGLNTLGAWLGVLLLGMIHRIKMDKAVKND